MQEARRLGQAAALARCRGGVDHRVGAERAEAGQLDGAEPFAIRRGERVAQLVVAPVLRALFAEVEEVSPSARGTGGFGSTGRD